MVIWSGTFVRRFEPATRSEQFTIRVCLTVGLSSAQCHSFSCCSCWSRWRRASSRSGRMWQKTCGWWLGTRWSCTRTTGQVRWWVVWTCSRTSWWWRCATEAGMDPRTSPPCSGPFKAPSSTPSSSLQRLVSIILVTKELHWHERLGVLPPETFL